MIDLGDVIGSWRVAELAVLAADVLGRTGSLALVGRAVRGFVTTRVFWEPYARVTTKGTAFLVQATLLTKPIKLP